jgi:hypothetical protein
MARTVGVVGGLTRGKKRSRALPGEPSVRIAVLQPDAEDAGGRDQSDTDCREDLRGLGDEESLHGVSPGSQGASSTLIHELGALLRDHGGRRRAT